MPHASHIRRPSSPKPPKRLRSTADLFAVIVITVLFAVASVHFELSEKISAWMQLRERYQFDELPGVLLVFTCCLLWFAWRRNGDMRIAMAMHGQAEAQLAHLLEENRRMARQLISLQESERRNLARELHDELGQYMNAIKVDAVTLQKRQGAGEAELLKAIVANIDHAYSSANDMIRRLRPVGLDTLGLAAAMEHCVDGWRARLPEMRFKLAIEGDFSGLDDMRSLTLYRITQESLTNVYKHASATDVNIFLQRSGNGQIALSIADNGIRQAAASLPDTHHGLGLIGMRERLLACGGTLDISATHGFRIEALLPAEIG